VYTTSVGPDGKIWLAGTGFLPGGDQAFMVARAIGVETTTTVVEFFNTELVHYFITADPNEAAAIDSGAAGPGWTRTGATWKSGGPNRVCRFYGSLDINPATGTRRGPNSHFYTIEAAECDAVKLDPGWRFESYDFSGWPSSAQTCPQGTTPVYRAYNNRFAQNDSNHRYATDGAIYNATVAQGWSGEGIVFCAPL
jgi:serine protease